MRNLLWKFHIKFEHWFELNRIEIEIERNTILATVRPSFCLCKSSIDKNHWCNDTMVKYISSNYVVCMRMRMCLNAIVHTVDWIQYNPKWKRNMSVHRKFGSNPLSIAKWNLFPKNRRKRERATAKKTEREKEKKNSKYTMHELLGWTDDDFVVFVEWPKLHTPHRQCAHTHTTHICEMYYFMYSIIRVVSVWRECGIEATSNNLELDNLKRLAAGIINRDSCQPELRKCAHTYTCTHTYLYITWLIRLCSVYGWSTQSHSTRSYK